MRNGVLGTERVFACAYVRCSVFGRGFRAAHTCFGRQEAMPPVCTHTGTSPLPFRGARGRHGAAPLRGGSGPAPCESPFPKGWNSCRRMGKPLFLKGR